MAEYRLENSEQTGRIDKVLPMLISGLSRAMAGRIVERGGVSVDGKPVSKGSRVVGLGQFVEVDTSIVDEVRTKWTEESRINEFGQNGDTSLVKPEDIRIDIVYEGDNLLIVDKAAGMVVHPAAGNTSGTLANALMWHFREIGLPAPKRVGLVHRLDKEVSGLMVVAKNDRTMRILAKQFSGAGIDEQNHAVQKMKARKLYWAVVGPTTEEGLKKAGLELGVSVPLEGYISRSKTNRTRYVVKRSQSSDDRASRYCLSHTKPIEKLDGGMFLLEIRLVTGRTHQIRAQLSSLKLPIVGDVLYGGVATDDGGHVRLKCVEMGIFMPRQVYKGEGNVVSNDVQASQITAKSRIKVGNTRVLVGKIDKSGLVSLTVSKMQIP